MCCALQLPLWSYRELYVTVLICVDAKRPCSTPCNIPAAYPYCPKKIHFGISSLSNTELMWTPVNTLCMYACAYMCMFIYAYRTKIY